MNVEHGHPRQRVERRRRLVALAAEQHGVVDRAQVAANGFDRGAAAYHRRVGNWMATPAPGVWRLAEWPETASTDVAAWSCWFGGTAQATGWSALTLLGVEVPSAPTVDEGRFASFGLAAGAPAADAVHVVLDMPLAKWRVEQSRSRRVALAEALADGRLVVHRVIGRAEALTVGGLRCRPIGEAVCIAICHRRGSSSATPLGRARALLSAVLDGGLLDRRALRSDAIALQATRVLDLLGG